MNPQIDLTENRDFRVNGTQYVRFKTIQESIPRLLRPKQLPINKTIESIETCLEQAIKSQNGGIIQGDKFFRKYMKETESNGMFCIRCGRWKKYPWQEYDGELCDRCNEDLRRDNNEIS